MRCLVIDLAKQDYEIVEREEKGVVELGVNIHLEERTYKDGPYETNATVFGCGPFADNGIPGTGRLTFVFQSPMTGSLYVSTMGGAGMIFARTGFDACVLLGRAKKTLEIRIKEDDVEFLDAKVSSDLKAIEFVLDRFVAAGVGGKVSDYGCIYSRAKDQGEDYAGRGGGGSVLIQYHNVSIIRFGGEKKREWERLDEEMLKKMLDGTVKYREKGTFLANYPHLKDSILAEYYDSVFDPELRKTAFEKAIGDTWTGYFKNVTVKTCGEPCPVACKKYYGDIKIDYEPMHALGILCGIYDFDTAAKLVDKVDRLGFDAIEMGATVALVRKLAKMGYDFPEDPNSIIDGIVSGDEKLEIFRKNKYEVVAFLEKEGIPAEEIVVHVRGITPTMYWALGNYLPILLPGRYWTNYKAYVPYSPDELREEIKSAMVKEALMDDLGICRFHRRWIFDWLQRKTNLDEEKVRIEEVISRIAEYNSKAPSIRGVSKRAVKVFERLLEEHGKEWKYVDYTYKLKDIVLE